MGINETLLYNLSLKADKTRLYKGRNLFSNDKVFITGFDDLDRRNIEIYSKVKGSYDRYNVKVNIKNFDVNLSGSECECLDYASNDNMCKHMVATVLEYVNQKTDSEQNSLPKTKEELEEIKRLEIEREKKRIKQQGYLEFQQILGQFSEENSTENRYGIKVLREKKELVDKIPNGSVRIIPNIKQEGYSNEINLSFQIGEKQLYKIKDLPEFFDSVTQGSHYRHGAKLEFFHNIEKFDQSAQKILPYILKYAQIIKYANQNSNVGNRYYYTSTNVLNKNHINLVDEAFDEFFDLFINEYVKSEKDGEKDEVLFLDEEPKINFELVKLDDEDYKLNNKFKNEYKDFVTKKYTYFLSNYSMYRCSKKFGKTTLKLLNNFKYNPDKDVIIKKEQLPLLFTSIIPKVKENIEFKNLDEEVEKYSPKELNVKLFFDFDDFGNIVSKVKFCYDELEINPFNEIEKIDCIRDIKGEKESKDLFESTGFEIVKENMVLIDEDDIYNFLSNDINKYMEKFEVMVTDKFKTKQIKQPKIGTLGVKVENNLLNINLENIDFDKSELKNIMQKYNLKKKYHRLKDGSFLDLQTNEDMDLINSFTDGMDIDYKTLSTGKIRVPVYRTVYLEKLLDNFKNTEIIKNDEYKSIINKIEDKEDNENIEVPKKFNKILRAYQKTGFKWLKVLDEYKFGGILADDMGLGKTLQLIVILDAYINSVNKKDKLPSLVVCPSSLSINWKNEVLKFAPSIKVLVVSGKAEDREEQIKSINKYDLVITSYDLLKRDIDTYNELKYIFKYVIADEAQYIKNSNTKNATALKSINANTRFALTGTPIENSLSELWSIFDYVMPGYLFSYTKFKKNYETPIVKNNDEKALKRLKMLIEPFILRRLKKEVLTELPDKTISILNNEMVEEQNKIYLSHLMKAKQEIQEELSSNGFEKSQIKILALITRLRQICCHPSLFIDNYKGESSKLNQCIEVVKDATESGHKILLFSQFTSMFDILEKEFAKEGIKYFKLTGQTKVSERMKLVEDFNKNKEIQVFLISLKAGGTGLNLTGADMVIHYDPWWNLSAENQATDRAYRIGQKNNVQVYKLITQNSIEEKINELQNKKAKLTDNMLSTEETFINKLSKDDIMSLFE